MREGAPPPPVPGPGLEPRSSRVESLQGGPRLTGPGGRLGVVARRGMWRRGRAWRVRVGRREEVTTPTPAGTFRPGRPSPLSPGPPPSPDRRSGTPRSPRPSPVATPVALSRLGVARRLTPPTPPSRCPLLTPRRGRGGWSGSSLVPGRGRSRPPLVSGRGRSCPSLVPGRGRSCPPLVPGRGRAPAGREVKVTPSTPMTPWVGRPTSLAPSTPQRVTGPGAPPPPTAPVVTTPGPTGETL